MPRPLARSLCFLLGALLALGLTQTACSDPEEDDTPEDNNASSNTTSSNNANNSTNNTQPHEADHCDDGEDNDGDGLADCEDEDCRGVGACPDWSCVDVDLGSALGRPVTDITAVGRGDDLDDECLSDAEDVVFWWTAPHDGVFAFDTTIPHLPLEVRVDGCASVVRWCGRSSLRSLVSLPLRQGQGVVIVTEGAATLGIKPGELPLELAGLVYGTGSRSWLDVTPDLTGDGHPELLLGPSSEPAAVLRLAPRGSLASPLPNHALSPLHDHELVTLGFGGQESPQPFTAEFDLNGDGALDLYVLTDPGGPLVYWGPPDLEAHRWHAEPVPSGPWRPAGAWGDLTGDGVPELVSWSQDGSRWEVYDDARRAWEADRAPVAILNAAVPYQADVGRPAAVCDFNGDGFGDLLVNSSTLLLVPGPVTATSDLNALAVPLGPSLSLAHQTKDLFVTGDFNADGRCDVVLRQLSTPSSAGGVVLFLGPLEQPLTPENADLRFVNDPAQALRGLGASVAAGDVNGDGFVDLALGAPAAHQDLPGSEQSSYGGLVFLFFGPLEQRGQVDPFTADRILTHNAPSFASFDLPTFGTVLALGDLDGDGMDEIAAFESSDHRLFIFPGARLTAGTFGQELQP